MQKTDLEKGERITFNSPPITTDFPDCIAPNVFNKILKLNNEYMKNISYNFHRTFDD